MSYSKISIIIFFLILSSFSEAKILKKSKFPDLDRDVTFMVGKEKIKYSLDKMEKEAKIKKFSLQTLEPHQNFKKTNYFGFETRSLLNFIYGDKWQTSELILFKCEDGYQDAVPTENIITFNSILAYKIEPITKNAPPPFFSLVNKGQHETIDDLGPLYLVWDNITSKELKVEESTHWPYQVVEIELAQFKDKFPKMIPPNTSPAVANGFKHFKKHCMSCHKINSEGGDKGPDLNLPTNIFSRLDEKTVRIKIDKPQSLNPQSTMPPLKRGVTDRKKVIDDIIAYLHAMKN